MALVRRRATQLAPFVGAGVATLSNYIRERGVQGTYRDIQDAVEFGRRVRARRNSYRAPARAPPPPPPAMPYGRRRARLTRRRIPFQRRRTRYNRGRRPGPARVYRARRAVTRAGAGIRARFVRPHRLGPPTRQVVTMVNVKNYPAVGHREADKYMIGFWSPYHIEGEDRFNASTGFDDFSAGGFFTTPFTNRVTQMATPAWYDIWRAQYNRYLVLNCDYEFTFRNNDATAADDLVVAWRLVLPQEDHDLSLWNTNTSGNLQILLAQGGFRKTTLGSTGADNRSKGIRTIKISVKPVKYTAKTDLTGYSLNTYGMVSDVADDFTAPSFCGTNVFRGTSVAEKWPATFKMTAAVSREDSAYFRQPTLLFFAYNGSNFAKTDNLISVTVKRVCRVACFDRKTVEDAA